MSTFWSDQTFPPQTWNIVQACLFRRSVATASGIVTASATSHTPATSFSSSLVPSRIFSTSTTLSPVTSLAITPLTPFTTVSPMIRTPRTFKLPNWTSHATVSSERWVAPLKEADRTGFDAHPLSEYSWRENLGEKTIEGSMRQIVWHSVDITKLADRWFELWQQLEAVARDDQTYLGMEEMEHLLKHTPVLIKLRHVSDGDHLSSDEASQVKSCRSQTKRTRF